MNKTKIRMYLSYWFEGRESQDIIDKDYINIFFPDAEFIKAKNGDNCIKFFEVSKITYDLEEVLDEFLNYYKEKLHNLNFLAKCYKGFYVIEIVPEIYNMETASMVLDKRFCDFVSKLNNFKYIDIDQYILNLVDYLDFLHDY